MGFGQPAGRPASSQQVKQLLALLADAGYADFREARGPLRLTQRQGGGKFTADEAAALIERLESEAVGEAEDDTGSALPQPAPRRTVSSTERALRAFSTEQLAAELQRRGWIVAEP